MKANNFSSQLFLLILCACMTRIGQCGSCEDARAQELKNIQDVGHGVAHDVFYVIAFDGVIPVPNRFMVKRGGNALRSFSSPPWWQESDPAELDANGDLCNVGSLVFIYSENGSTIDLGSNPGVKILKKYEYRGFVVEEYDVHYEGSPTTLHNVAVRDNKEVLTIHDSNKQLWKAMIDAYLQLKELNKAHIEGSKNGTDRVRHD